MSNPQNSEVVPQGHTGKETKVLSQTPGAIQKREEREVLRRYREQTMSILECQDREEIFEPPREWDETVEGVTAEGKLYHRLSSFGTMANDDLCSHGAHNGVGKPSYRAERATEGLGFGSQSAEDRGCGR